MPTLMGVDMGIVCNMRIYHARTLECRNRSCTLDVNWENTYTSAVMIHIDMPHVAIHRSYILMDTQIK